MNFLLIFLFIVFKYSASEAIETSAKQEILYDYETNSVIIEKNLFDNVHYRLK